MGSLHRALNLEKDQVKIGMADEWEGGSPGRVLAEYFGANKQKMKGQGVRM